VIPSQAANDRPTEITIMTSLSISPIGARASTFSAGAVAEALRDMLNRAERVLEVDPRQARVFIGQASRLLEPTLNGSEARTASLAPWQERKVLRYIGERLDQSISNQELAGLVGLSVSHFGRCFKSSFGVSPHDYLIQGRVEWAKRLMRETNAALSEIALDSGFADQSHLCRVFRVVVGRTPSRWRRDHKGAVSV
jgi:AraC family transcriptional regulator